MAKYPEVRILTNNTGSYPIIRDKTSIPLFEEVQLRKIIPSNNMDEEMIESEEVLTIFMFKGLSYIYSKLLAVVL